MAFEEDLIVDRVYRGGRKGNSGDDPLPKLLGVSNQGGFRYLGHRDAPSLLVLVSSFSDLEWPDQLDRESGVLTYYGDNKKPGRALHDTPRFGNKLLKQVFSLAQSGGDGRRMVPPILAFSQAAPYRDKRFVGLVVPGSVSTSATEELTAIWKSYGDERFQNYRARFSVLEVGHIDASWLEERSRGRRGDAFEPSVWSDWAETGRIRALRAERSRLFRNPAEQRPSSARQEKLIEALHKRYSTRPHAFERVAAAIVEMVIPGVLRIDTTRPSRDGGYDAVGKFRIGSASNGVDVDFAVEAKCYARSSSVGVRDLSRLISRLRHRQFGVLVTTSHLGEQAYREVVEDEHPILVLSGRDIAEHLEAHDLGDVGRLNRWLDTVDAG